MFIADRLTKIGEGVYIDENPAPCDDSDIEAHYEADALNILRSDVGHYAGLKACVLDGSPLDKPCGTVADIAGGHPKLASCLDCASVTVYDRQAYDYERHHAEFLEIYCDTAGVDYVKADITDADFAPSADLAIFCHILEHLTLQQGGELIKRVDAPSILIYGPNIATAQDEDWFHYAPKDHRTFYTIEAMAKVLWYAGYSVTYGVEYHQDYLLYGELR